MRQKHLWKFHCVIVVISELVTLKSKTLYSFKDTAKLSEVTHNSHKF